MHMVKKFDFYPKNIFNRSNFSSIRGNWNFCIVDIPQSDITWKFSRSSGPGGQNVNKVNTKADMRIIIEHASWIPDHIKQKLLQQQSSRINYQKDTNLHELCVTSSEFRTQDGNKKACLERLYSMLQSAAKEEAIPSKKQREHVENLALKFQNQIYVTKQYRQDKKNSRRMDTQWKHD